MNIKDISISKGMTVNLGNYNSHRVDVGITVSFDDGDDFDKSIEQLAKMVNKKLTHEIKVFNDTMDKKQVLMEQERA